MVVWLTEVHGDRSMITKKAPEIDYIDGTKILDAFALKGERLDIRHLCQAGIRGAINTARTGMVLAHLVPTRVCITVEVLEPGKLVPLVSEHTAGAAADCPRSAAGSPRIPLLAWLRPWLAVWQRLGVQPPCQRPESQEQPHHQPVVPRIRRWKDVLKTAAHRARRWLFSIENPDPDR